MIPEPGNPQSLNRYSYVLNRPLILVDPTGMTECAASDTQCWIREWEWKNRWYEAHGWFADKDGWTRPDDPKMQDAEIARDVLAEAGIHLSSGGWGRAEIMEMAHGVARFGQKLSRGLAQLRELLGASVRVRDWSCAGRPCAPPVQVLASWELWWPSNYYGLAEVAGNFVHELAHIIDWHSSYSFSGRWGYPALTDYAADNQSCYPQSWDRWAEAVAVWVMGDFDVTGAFATSFKSTEVGKRIQPSDLAVQMSRMADLLNGRR